MYWYISKYKFPVTLVPQQNKIIIKYPYFPQWKLIVDEIKSFEGWRYHPEEKYWSIRKSPRNEFSLSVLADPKKLKPLNYEHPDINNPKLWPQQVDAVNHILTKHRAIIAYDMGLGKCLIALTALEQLKRKAWIVCPKNIIIVWRTEIEKWKPKIPEPKIFNYEQLTKQMKAATVPPEALILDESVYIKNPASKRSQLIKSLTDLQREYYSDPVIILLCGTPAPKDPTDWWHQIEVIFPGWLRESSNIKLKHRLAEIEWVETEIGKYPKVVGWKEDEIKALGKRIAPLVITAKQKENKRYIELKVPPSEDIKASAKFVTDISETGIEALVKLREISDGFLYTQPKKPVFMPSAKLDRYKSLLKEIEFTQRNRLITYASFTASIDKLTEISLSEGWSVIRVDGRGWKWKTKDKDIYLHTTKPQTLYKRFQSTLSQKINFIAHPQSAGEGLTLPSDIIIFYSNDFNPKNRQQAEARTRNPNVIIYDLLHLETDALILKALKQGKSLQSITLEEIKKWNGQNIHVETVLPDSL